MLFCRILGLLSFSIALSTFPVTLIAASGSSAPYSAGQGQSQLRSPPPKPAPAKPAYKPGPQKPLLPVMNKPFGMPGVVGFANGKWEGNDYLGYLSSNISLSVEVVKGEQVPAVDEGSLESLAKEIFTKENLSPQAVVEEGPLLPFFQVLIFIFPVEKDKFAIFAAGRLFESIDVKRKHFSPAGYWQAITWENQDVVLATSQDLLQQVKTSTEKIVKGFAARYRQYNPSNPETPKGPHEAALEPIRSGLRLGRK